MRLENLFWKAERAATDLVEAFWFGIFGPPRRRELSVEHLRPVGPADLEGLRRALVASHPFIYPEKTMKTTPPAAADAAACEKVLISTPDVSRVMARVRAIAMGNPRETDANGKPLPPLDLLALVLMLGSDLSNLRETEEKLVNKAAEAEELLDELRTVSANDNRCNAEVIEKLRAEVERLTVESVATDLPTSSIARLDAMRVGRDVMADELRAARVEIEKLRMVNEEMAEHERIAIATLQAEIASLNRRLSVANDEERR